MRNKFITLSIMLLCGLQVCCPETVSITTTATIFSKDGKPIPGASILISYLQKITGEYNSDRGLTDENGQFSFTGKALYDYVIRVEKDGYYKTYFEDDLYEVIHNKRVYKDVEKRLVLEEIRNPIPMYARAGLEFVIPEPNKEFGFDLEVADWVAPHGKGRNTDIIFAVNGYYNGRNDNESRLLVSFPNEGDGLIEIGGNYRKGSKLMSPHVAPEEGYTPRKEWSKSSKENPDATAEAHTKYLIAEDYEQEGVNYLFIVRTILAPQGNVVSAHYGKIYGDFKFFGAHEDGSFIDVDALYFNPTTNDRNLEYKVGENLNTGLRHSLNPHLP